jgi:hypothetical protein
MTTSLTRAVAAVLFVLALTGVGCSSSSKK